jgi:hypothetical protein
VPVVRREGGEVGRDRGDLGGRRMWFGDTYEVPLVHACNVRNRVRL